MAFSFGSLLSALMLSWTTSIILVLFVLVLIITWLHQKPKDFPPGPRGLPIFGNVFAFEQDDAFADTLMRWGKEHGPVYGVSIGLSNDVVVCGAEMIKTLLVKKGLDFADKPKLVEADLYNKDRRGEHACLNALNTCTFIFKFFLDV